MRCLRSGLVGYEEALRVPIRVLFVLLGTYEQMRSQAMRDGMRKAKMVFPVIDLGGLV